ncbi:acyl-CoA dehydrogenase family protein [uncultured Sphingomonas sp.]|uniref:acyl-CoA dehydrogenase family protein n=1 Tax=uncultured Sphingomonas sp. TaxID=158754 RepID=UPI0035CB4F16
MRAALQYQPREEQRSLGAEIEAPLRALLPIARLHGGEPGETAAVWHELEALGILAAARDEAAGGSGLGAVETALIAIELGRRLASPAVFATMAGATVLRGTPTPVAAAFDREVWIDEPGATLRLVRGEDGAALSPLSETASVIDDQVWGVRLMRGAIATPIQALDVAALRLLRLLDAAALTGIAAATLDMAVDYAKTREQFGRPIGSFQAIKHHCANMAIAARAALDLTTFAAVAIDGGRAGVAHQTESAFLVAADAAIGNAGLNIQIHGGIGFSAEADPHLFLKRAQLIAALGGGVEAATLRVAASRPDEGD